MHCLVDSQCLSRPTLHKSTQWDRCALAKHIIHARVQLLGPPQQSLAGPTVLTHTACDTHLVVYLRLGGVRFFKKATCAIRNEGAMQDPLAHGYTRGDSKHKQSSARGLHHTVSPAKRSRVRLFQPPARSRSFILFINSNLYCVI